MNTSFRIPKGAVPCLNVNVSIQPDCSVARGRQISFLILMSRVSRNVGKDWRVLSSATPPYVSTSRKDFGWHFLATSPSLKTTLTCKETLSQDQGPECRVDGVRNQEIREMCPLTNLPLCDTSCIPTDGKTIIENQKNYTLLFTRKIHTLPYKPPNKRVNKNFSADWRDAVEYFRGYTFVSICAHKYL